jgi:hypothetical protein
MDVREKRHSVQVLGERLDGQHLRGVDGGRSKKCFRRQ